MELNLVHDRQHEIHRILAFLLEDICWSLGQAGLLSRVEPLHDFLELDFLDLRSELCVNFFWHLHIYLLLFFIALLHYV